MIYQLIYQKKDHGLDLTLTSSSFSFPSFLLNFVYSDLIFLSMFCFNLTESNITLEIFFHTSELILSKNREMITNHNKRKINYCIYILFLILNEFSRKFNN